MKKSILEILNKRARKRRCRIGISILKENEEILDSLKRTNKFADVVIYSDHAIKGFETNVFKTESEIGKALVNDLKEGEIDQFVRGQIDDFNLVDEFKRQFKVPEFEKRIGFGLLEDVKGRQFFLAIVSNPEGQTLKDKIRIMDGITNWLKKEFKMKPKVAVMATCRPGSVGKDLNMTRSYKDAESVVKFLKKKGIEAKNIHIELQSALPWANLIMAANGTIGNQIFRALVLLGGGKMYFVPSFFKNGATYEDNSRNEQDYYYHILACCAIANSKKK